PLRREPERLIAVSYNPENLKHQSEIGYFAGAPVQLVLARARDVEAALGSVYGLTAVKPLPDTQVAAQYLHLRFDDTTPQLEVARLRRRPSTLRHRFSGTLPRRFEEIELLERISVGGMAEIYRGIDHCDPEPREVAVKMLLPGHDREPRFLEMFRDEARIAAHLRHRNICDVYRSGVLDTQPYLVMEFIDGLDLRSLLEVYALEHDERIALAIHIVVEVADALAYAHELRDDSGQPLQLIHRDVSPPNILIDRHGAVKLIDFGIAKVLGNLARTQAGMLKGKLGYMSPEQIACTPLDHRSDQFSLAIVLWELLTGQPLFRGSTDIETLERQTSMRIPDARQYLPTIPRDLLTIVERALERHVDGRFANCAAFSDALRVHLPDEGHAERMRRLGLWVASNLRVDS
ncbi:MAG: serine/threonine protein kinase, partial [Myxococcales bacterium]|nr:serine/threonine protein kinase [Myxococcales bacterium]